MNKKFLRNYGIKIQSLSNNIHEYDFEFNQDLIDFYSDENELKDVSGICNLNVSKSDLMLEVLFKIQGKTKLVCDRTLKNFTYSLNSEKKMQYLSTKTSWWKNSRAFRVYDTGGQVSSLVSLSKTDLHCF